MGAVDHVNFFSQCTAVVYKPEFHTEVILFRVPIQREVSSKVLVNIVIKKKILDIFKIRLQYT